MLCCFFHPQYYHAVRAGYLLLTSGWESGSPSMKISIGLSVVGSFFEQC